MVETSEKSEKLLESDKIGLKNSGFSKRKQIRFILMLSPTFLCLGMVVMSPVFLNITPEYECQQNSDRYACSPGNKITYEDFCKNVENKDNCLRYIFLSDEYPTSSSNFSTNVTSNVLKEPCSDGWQFNTSRGNTIVSQFSLVCESSWKRPLTVSLFMAGMMIGSMFGGQISDRLGRKKTSLSAFFLHAVFEVVLSFSPTYWFYASFVFVLGIVHIIIYLCTYIWAQELVHSSDKRSLAAFCGSAAFGLGSMSMSLTAYISPDWNWIYRIFAIISFAYFPVLLLVPESHAWSLLQNKTENEALQVDVRSKKESTKKVENVEEQKKIMDHSQTDTDKESSAYLLFHNRILLRRILSACFLWNVAYLDYYTMVLNSSNLGGSSYLNNLIGGALDVGAASLMMGLLKRFSRRNTLASLYAIFAFFSITSPPVKNGNEAAGLVFAMTGRFFATTSMLLTILYTGELFPTLLRNTSVGIASMSARIASILCPFLIFAGEELDLSIPFYVMGGTSLLGVYVVLLLPKTSISMLPNTLEEALALENKKFTFNCTKRKNGSK